jgi:lactate racemase
VSNNIKLAYGREEQIFSHDGIDILSVLKVADIPPVESIGPAIKSALNNPIECPPLKKVVSQGDRVALIVNDDTRVANTAAFLPYLLSEIEAGGVSREDIAIVFSNGTHRLLPEKIQAELLGEEIFGRYRIINHDCHDRENLVYVGTTSRGNRVEINRTVADADKVILTGSIVYHFFAGYGGGRKAMVPGVAGFDTILFNHRLMLEPGAELGRLEGNPVHEDLLEAARLAKPNFLFNAVLNDKKQFLGFFAGDYIKAHKAGCQLVDRAYGVEISEKADLVVASCGGHPKDLNMYQAQKTLDNAVRAVSPGGVVILLARCPEGLGSAVLDEWLDRYSSPAEIYEAVKKNFVIGGHKAYAISRLTEKAKIIMVSELPDTVVSKAYMHPARDLQVALDMALSFLNKDKPTAYIMPQGSLTLPCLR